MEIFWDELTGGLVSIENVIRMTIRIVAAIGLGAALGIQRERAGKPAGVKTHTLATLGTTVFVLACTTSGMLPDAQSRVIQGIVTGIGFLGAGAILKQDDLAAVKGLTTAAMIWVSASVGVACGLGEVGLAIIVTVLAIIVVSAMSAIEWKVTSVKQEDEA